MFEDEIKEQYVFLLRIIYVCRQNKSSIVISREESDKYFDFIDICDVEEFIKFLEKIQKKNKK